MKHKITVNILLLLTLCFATRLAYAATFTQEVLIFDYQSLLVAALGGFCGGTLKTIFTLATDNRAVFAVLKEARKDLLVSFLAGAAAYLLMIVVESRWPGTITREMRFFGVVTAGWLGKLFFMLLSSFARAKADNVAAGLRAGAPPSSAAVPLGDK